MLAKTRGLYACKNAASERRFSRLEPRQTQSLLLPSLLGGQTEIVSHITFSINSEDLTHVNSSGGKHVPNCYFDSTESSHRDYRYLR